MAMAAQVRDKTLSAHRPAQERRGGGAELVFAGRPSHHLVTNNWSPCHESATRTV